VEIVKQGKYAIKRWFGAIKKEGEKRLNEVKVLLVGYGGVGKTSLVRKLTTDEFNINEPKTHGVNRTDWKIKVDGEDITVHFWDYGGQGIMQATHRVFFSQRSLYVLVIDARQESDPEEWLKNIESIGGNSPVIVVINKIDEHPFGLNETGLRRKYSNIGGFYHVSCKDNTNIDFLKAALIKEAWQVRTRSIVWPRLWSNVREKIGELGKDYISYSEYEEICRKEGVKEELAHQDLLGILNDLGAMLYFPDRPLADMEVLNPEWATDGIYKIINSAELKKCKGMLPGDRLDYVLNKERLNDDVNQPRKYTNNEQQYLVELMNKFELCYELKDSTLFVPDLLTEQEPPEGLPEKPDVQFYFEYDFMPAVVMPRFMVQKQSDLDIKLCWRTGAVLKNKTFDSTAVVRQDKNRRRINIDVTGKEAKGYLSTIRDTIIGINESFAKLPYEEWVPLPDEPEYAVKYKDLIGHQDSKRDEKFVGELKKGYSVAKLLDGIEDPLEREFGRFHLYPPFFEILPGERSFDEAWEIFCCDVLNRHEKTTEIVRRKPPDDGVDLLWHEQKRAYQCKSVIDPATGRFDVGKAVESIEAAITKRKETGWETFYICSNVDVTGPQEEKLREKCPGVELKLLTPGFWLPRCREQAVHLRGRFSELRRPRERF
jgi:small GTP-binding protein